MSRLRAVELEPEGDSRWSCSYLDPADAVAVEEYERCLFETFHPLLGTNPLLRELWLWNDAGRRLRTQLEHRRQRIAILRDRVEKEIRMCVGVNLQPSSFWQSGDYGFELPGADEAACEFLIFGGGRKPAVGGAFATRHFARDFLFAGLVRSGYRTAYATTADGMLWFYRRIGATVADQRIVRGYRRTLLRWDLEAAARGE